MIDTTQLIKRMEAEYDLDTGFLGRLRQGVFDQAGLDRLLALLRAIDFGDQDCIDRRVVALLWLIPTLMMWQQERVIEHGGDVRKLRQGIDVTQSELNRILGMP